MRIVSFVCGGVFVSLTASAAAAAQARAPECREVRECRQLALDAAARGAYESFHDLAWRAIQVGPSRDPELMYLLARAQSLSNRPTDALVTLRRLAEMGIVYDVETHDDLRRTRALPGWPQVEAVIRRAAAGARAVPPPAGAAPPPDTAAGPPSAPSAAPPAPPAVAPDGSRSASASLPPSTSANPAAPARPRDATAKPETASRVAPAAAAPPRASPRIDQRPVSDAVRFQTERFVPGGLAYDSVSRRFLVGDLQARKVIVVGEGSDRAIDMVRAESARFHDVRAMAIDVKRGDLWVVSSGADGRSGALHKLQLISGRPLALVELPPDLRPVRLTDVSVTGAGTVLALDSAGSVLLRLPANGKTLENVMALDVERPVSMAVADPDRVYVAHQRGLSSVDLGTRRTSALTGPDGVDLSGFEWLRWYRGALVGMQVSPTGSRRVMRLRLNRSGSAVSEAVVVDASLPPDSGPTFATVADDELYYLAMTSSPSPSGGATPGAPSDVVVRRVELR